MIQLLFYSYCTGVLSSRGIQRATEENLTFRFLAENERPDFRVVANFRRDHFENIQNMFVELLRLSGDLGLGKLGNIELDPKPANQDGAIVKNTIELQVWGLLEEAERLDKVEDSRFGRELMEQELPAELQTVEGRLRRLKQIRSRVQESRREYKEKSRVKLVEEQSGSQANEPGSLSGSFFDSPFPEVLGRLYQKRATGVIECSKGYRQKSVYLRSGYPVFIESNLVSECLGSLLVRSKVITQSQCDTSLRMMMSTGKSQGSVLIEMGCISPRNLDRVLDLQQQRKLFNLFSWEEGEYKFKPGVPAPESRIKLNMTSAAAIHKGIQTQFKPQRVIWQLNNYMDSLVIPHPHPRLRFQKMELNQEEELVLSQIRGDKTLRQLRDDTQDRDCLYKLIYAFACAGMIVFDKPRNKDKEVRESKNKERERLARKIHEMKGQDYHEQLGLDLAAQPSKIERVFNLHAKQYGPEHVGREDSTQIRLLRSEIFKTLSTAYDMLIGDSQNADDQRTPEFKQVKGALDPNNVLTEFTRAEELARRGQAAMRSRDYAWAKVLYQQAVKLCPEIGEYRAELARAIFLTNPDKTSVGREARDHINRAISLDPKLAAAHLYLGQIYSKMGHQMMAEHEYKKAVDINPGYTDALRELRACRQSAKLKKSKRRGLGRLFRQ
jgi:tetratricopeptide (TPR) repeat protein